MSHPPQQQTITIGPNRLRLHLGDWQQLEVAAAEGLLDEHTYVELKLALPPAGKNVETARDLASFGVLGGVLVVGIKDEGGGKAGEVVGLDNPEGTRDRLVAIADASVQPPLPCEILIIEHPDQTGRGCVICVVPPSAQAPHRADERYWGRSSTGKRVLSDPEVATLFAERRHVADRFREELLALQGSFDPVRPGQRQGGHLYLAAKPKQLDFPGRPPWQPNDTVLTVIGSAVLSRGSGGPNFGGAHYSVGHPSGLLAQSFPSGEQPEDGPNFLKILIKDDGSVHAVSGLGTFQAQSRTHQSEMKVIMLSATAVQVDQFVRAAGLVADRLDIWGAWTIGVRISDLSEARPYTATASGA
jgi:hypothetical protein